MPEFPFSTAQENLKTRLDMFWAKVPVLAPLQWWSGSPWVPCPEERTRWFCRPGARPRPPTLSLTDSWCTAVLRPPTSWKCCKRQKSNVHCTLFHFRNWHNCLWTLFPQRQWFKRGQDWQDRAANPFPRDVFQENSRCPRQNYIDENPFPVPYLCLLQRLRPGLWLCESLLLSGSGFKWLDSADATNHFQDRRELSDRNTYSWEFIDDSLRIANSWSVWISAVLYSPEFIIALQIGHSVVLPEAEKSVDHVDHSVLNCDVCPDNSAATLVIADVHCTRQRNQNQMLSGRICVFFKLSFLRCFSLSLPSTTKQAKLTFIVEDWRDYVSGHSRDWRTVVFQG